MNNTKHIYESARETFLPWNVWIVTFGTKSEIELHDSLIGDPVAKEELYQKWLADQLITKHITKVDGQVTQTIQWVWN